MSLNDCGHLQGVNFALEGEPFCYPHLFQALDAAMAASDAISIATNGSLLTRETLRRLSQYRFSLFSLSVDAGDERGYARFRKGGSFSTFVRNAGMAVEFLGDAVIFNAVLCQQNLATILGLPELAFRTGVGIVSLMQLRPHRGSMMNGVTPARTEDLLACLERFLERAEQYHIRVYFDEFFGDDAVMDWLASRAGPVAVVPHRMPGRCVIPWRYTSILSSGVLFPCCGDFQPVKIASYTFDGIFNHEYLRMLRGHVSEGRKLQACARCRHEMVPC